MHGRAAKPRRDPVDHSRLAGRVYDAFASGKSESHQPGSWTVDYAGNCESPLPVKSYASSGALFVTTLTRCRRCKPCLRAKQFYWSRTAMRWTEFTHQQGARTWFGTLTLSPVSQQIALDEARSRWCEEVARTGAIPDWWDDVTCDERFRLVRNELVGWVKRYWKRMRKGTKRCERCYPTNPRKAGEWDHPPASFKYFLVFERHKSGLPHMHFLMHECGEPIRLKHLECQWPHGFVKVNVVKGGDIRRAAFYVAKYLGKAFQARQIASLRYARVDPAAPEGDRGQGSKQSS